MKAREPVIAMAVCFAAAVGGGAVHSAAVIAVGLAFGGFFAMLAFVAMGLT